MYELTILLFVDAAEPMNDFVGIFPMIVFKIVFKLHKYIYVAC